MAVIVADPEGGPCCLSVCLSMQRARRLRDAGAAFLAGAMKSNKSITSVDLSFNQMAAATGVQMGVILHHNKSLTFLDISGTTARSLAGS